MYAHEGSRISFSKAHLSFELHSGYYNCEKINFLLIHRYLQNMHSFTSLFYLRNKALLASVSLIALISLWTSGPAYSYPVFAQQNYANPREANGRIVCANCHLAQKSVEIEVPQSVLPDTVFEAVVKSPMINK